MFSSNSQQGAKYLGLEAAGALVSGTRKKGGDGRRTGDEGVPYTCSEGDEAGVAARALPALPVTLISTASAWGQHFKIFTSELALDEATQEAILGKTSQKLWLG